eukprot:338616-Pyramimonas_sp.AAC.2
MASGPSASMFATAPGRINSPFPVSTRAPWSSSGGGGTPPGWRSWSVNGPRSDRLVRPLVDKGELARGDA